MASMPMMPTQPFFPPATAPIFGAMPPTIGPVMTQSPLMFGSMPPQFGPEFAGMPPPHPPPPAHLVNGAGGGYMGPNITPLPT